LNCNYGYIIHDRKTGQTAAIDTPDANKYLVQLNKRQWKLTHIFNTHHHLDHSGGNMQLKEHSKNFYSQQEGECTDVTGKQVQIFGSKMDGHSIPGLDVPLVLPGHTSTSVKFGNTDVNIIDVGGHTKGHIAFYFPHDKVVFVGDALFALGCGKMFEGTPNQYWESLKRLRNLPDDTVVYW
jgi:hydroxyacylglutathione hydrolase